MLCQKCGKKNANVKIVKNINGNVEELYLCSSCAGNEDLNFNSVIDNKIFGNLFNIFSPLSSNELICDSCKTSYSEFKKTGKFGCSECFLKFASFLDPLFKNVHGAVSHTGKLPQKSAEPIRIKRKIEELKRNLSLAISEENFEEAAKLRDEIKALQKEA